LAKALRKISLLGINLTVSPVVETEAWGYDDAKRYLNLVCSLDTVLSPRGLLQEVLAIEREMGRVRSGPIYEARIIDIDIVLYGDEILQHGHLEVPHPRMHLRRFVLWPLHQLAPHIVHPVLHKSIAVLLHECPDESIMVPYLHELPVYSD
jgi:2-amino-4-hydroxy-6-hydroxymethyldihydropteridine diphosphokinase